MNNEIADIFDEIATILELKDENPFKITAYRNSARIIRDLKEDLSALHKNDQLKNIKGFGKTSIEKISEYLSTGKLKYYVELKDSIPTGIFDLLKINGLGPKKVKKIWNDLNITNLGELEYACNENRLIKLEGFGGKTQKKIVDSIEFLKHTKNRFLIDTITVEADLVLNKLKSLKETISVDVVGELRRGAEIYDGLGFLITTQNPKNIINQIANLDFFTSYDIKEENYLKFRSINGIIIDIFFCEPSELAETLHYLTGSESYLKSLTGFLSKTEFEFRGKFLYRNSEKIVCKTEENIFQNLKLQYIPPECREGIDEIKLARKHQIPELITIKDIKGALHIHTNYSDGLFNLEEMASEAQKLGFEYIGICDHSKNAAYAHGLKEEDVFRQSEEIDILNKKFKNFRIIKGIESDILRNGDLDFPDSTLDNFDFVIGSIHSNFNLSIDEMTERILKSIKNKYTNIIGHPTGRLLLARESYQVNMDKIIKACIENDVALELNADEHRLDLSWKILKEAVAKGLKVAINTDAHHIKSLEKIKYGILMARKAGITAKDCINALDYKNFILFSKNRRLKG